MNKHIKALGALIIAILIPLGLLAEETPLDYRPSWKAGQTWVVAVNRASTHVKLGVKGQNKEPFKAKLIEDLYHFEVIGMELLDDEMCWCIEIRPVMEPEQSSSISTIYRVFFRESDSTLKCLRTIRVDRPELKNRDHFFLRGPVVAPWEAETLPMEFPLFKGDFVDIVPTRAKRADGTEYTATGKDITQISRILDRGGRKDSALQIAVKNNGRPAVSTLQMWEKGLPWWSEAIVEIEGKLEYAVKLTSLDGIGIPKAKSRMWSPKIIDNKLGFETNETFTVVEAVSTNAIMKSVGIPETSTENKEVDEGDGQ